MTVNVPNAALSLIRLAALPAILAVVTPNGASANAQAVPPSAPPGASAAATAPNPGPSITGFRGVTFGMTEAEVKGAAGQEFNLPVSAFHPGANLIQHTSLLSVAVPNLIANGGTASINYIFGYQSHKLIQINVLWSSAVDPHTTPQMLVQNGVTLQQYFAGEGFPPSRTAGNIVTENGILLFRATDTAGNAILLVLSGPLQKDPKTPDKSYLLPNTLTLTYAETPEHPDIFQLRPGSF